MTVFDLNRKERNAINSLKRLARRWPDSLWLFSASGTLHIMRTDELGRQVHLANDGVDPKYCVETVNIENDGGDW